MLMRASESALVVIDIQERLVAATHDAEQTLENASLLLRAAQACDVPALLTEQYKKGLGNTPRSVLASAGPVPIIEKTHFSCMGNGEFRKAFEKLDRKQAVLCGMEAHVCVLQTAEELLQEGYQVFFVLDASASRTSQSKQTAITRLNASGVIVVTTEMVVFEWLGKAGTPAFKQLLPLIKTGHAHATIGDAVLN